MIIDYEFSTDFLGHNEEYNEDYFDTQDYVFEIGSEQEREVAIEMIKVETNFNNEMAEKVFDFLDNNGLLDEYLQGGEDFIKDYFRNEAEQQFRENWRD